MKIFICNGKVVPATHVKTGKDAAQINFPHKCDSLNVAKNLTKFIGKRVRVFVEVIK